MRVLNESCACVLPLVQTSTRGVSRTSDHDDPYALLGVRRYASPSEIARAYRRAARATHPDSTSASPGPGERFHAVSEAYDTLRDPQRRAAYDRSHPLAPPTDPGPRAVRSGGGRHIVLGQAQSVAPMQDPLVRLVYRLLRDGW